jgi:glycosyltransferase involved in cell wall biosynthesis
MNVALIHYAYAPVIGGVEFVMEQHVALFARHGYAVRVICGSGAGELPGVEISVVEQLHPGNVECAAAQEGLSAGGEADPAFQRLKEALKNRLREELESCDVVFVHNLMTMHFNLAATAALAELATELRGVRFVNWVHDMSAINPDYDLPRLTDYPWRLITEALPDFQVAVISAERRRQLCALMGLKSRDCPVVANGVEILKVLKLTPKVRGLVRQFGILYRDIVLIHPTRILRRKNVEYGIRVLAALKKLGKSAVYLVTGAPDPHNAASRDYGQELKELVSELNVEREFHFISEQFKVSDSDLHSLYLVSDLLFLPSRQEGFGLPLLEAGVFRIPVFCPAIEPMQSILRNNVKLFELEDDPAEVASSIIELLDERPGYRARKEVMRKYSWERLFSEEIEPRFLAPSPEKGEAGRR